MNPKKLPFSKKLVSIFKFYMKGKKISVYVLITINTKDIKNLN